MRWLSFLLAGLGDVNAAATGGAQGLRAEYWDNMDLTGAPTLNRTDYAPSFHWYHWGPDPVRLPSSSFSVRWTGTVTSDATVTGATVSIFALNAYGGAAFGRPLDHVCFLKIRCGFYVVCD